MFTSSQPTQLTQPPNRIQRLPLPIIPPNWNTLKNYQIGLRIYTYSYFPYDLVSSTLQKSIRRSKDFEAIQSTVEIFESGSNAAKTNLWNRLLTIAVEDIGIANPDLIVQIYDLSIQNTLLAAVTSAVLLSQSTKCRANDWALHLKFELQTLNNIEIIYKLNNEKNILDTIKYTNYLIYKDPPNKKSECIILLWNLLLNTDNPYIKKIYQLYMSKNWKWSEKGRLLIMHCIHLVKLNLVPQKLNTITPDIRLQQFIDICFSRTYLLGIPDYAIDKHTALGIQLKRDLHHFITVGSVYTNVDTRYADLNDMYLKLFLEQKNL